jgi:hypothetical protein
MQPIAYSHLTSLAGRRRQLGGNPCCHMPQRATLAAVAIATACDLHAVWSSTLSTPLLYRPFFLQAPSVQQGVSVRPSGSSAPGEACSLANRQHVLDAFTWLEDLEAALTSLLGRDAQECDLRRGGLCQLNWRISA